MRGHVADGNEAVAAGPGHENAWHPRFVTGVNREAPGSPRLPPAVEDGHRVVAEPAQHPPQPRGHRAAAIVEADDLDRVVDSPR